MLVRAAQRRPRRSAIVCSARRSSIGLPLAAARQAAALAAAVAPVAPPTDKAGSKRRMMKVSKLPRNVEAAAADRNATAAKTDRAFGAAELDKVAAAGGSSNGDLGGGGN
jgi:hypothetical protein